MSLNFEEDIAILGNSEVILVIYNKNHKRLSLREQTHLVIKNQVTGIFYKVECKTCTIVYIGESKRSWNSLGTEHKPGTRGNNDSAIWKQHAEMTGHDIHPSYLEILERGVNNRRKRLFLESLHSTLTTNAVNERQPFPKAYLPLITSLRDLEKFLKKSF